MFHPRLVLEIEPQSFARFVRTHRSEERRVLRECLFHLRSRHRDVAVRELTPHFINRHTTSLSFRFQQPRNDQVVQAAFLIA